MEREIDFDEFNEVSLVAHKLGGCYPLSVESDEDPFESNFTTFDTDMTILFRVCYEDGEVDEDECQIEDFSKNKDDWKEWLNELKK